MAIDRRVHESNIFQSRLRFDEAFHSRVHLNYNFILCSNSKKMTEAKMTDRFIRFWNVNSLISWSFILSERLLSFQTVCLTFSERLIWCMNHDCEIPGGAIVGLLLFGDFSLLYRIWIILYDVWMLHFWIHNKSFFDQRCPDAVLLLLKSLFPCNLYCHFYE